MRGPSSPCRRRAPAVPPALLLAGLLACLPPGVLAGFARAQGGTTEAATAAATAAGLPNGPDVTAAGTAEGRAPAAAPASDLVHVVILSRHGVRTPLSTDAELAAYAAGDWPQWPDKPGVLTANGARQMQAMGSYFRERYMAEGLLTGDPAADDPRIFVRSDCDERTIASAEALDRGLEPAAPPAAHHHPGGPPGVDRIHRDTLFGPTYAHLGHPDEALLAASVAGQSGGDARLMVDQNRAAFAVLERILSGGAPLPAGRVPVLDAPAPGPMGADPVPVGLKLAEAILLEYADGMPAERVGWGRLRRDDIMPLSALVVLGFGAKRTYYASQVIGSNLALHTLATLRQAAGGTPVDSAFGRPGDRLTLLVGHDDNLIALGRQLGAHWQIPQGAMDVPMPGGAIVLELRRVRTDGRLVVRTAFISETYDQIRAGGVPTLERPPAVSPMFVPGGSAATAGYDVPLERFAALLGSTILPEFTQPEPADVR